MLCVTCITIFQGPERAGIHHQSFDNLVRAGSSGCKICLHLLRLRESEGADEAGELARPFTSFRFHAWVDGSEGDLDSVLLVIASVASWLARTFEKDIRLHISAPTAVPKWWPQLLEQADLDLKTEPWRVREAQFDVKPSPSNTGDPGVADLCLDWLNGCLDQHESCDTIDETRQADFYPERLLDVGTLESPSTHLVVTTDHGLRSTYQYATLSHCWGSNASFIKLTEENFTSLCAGISHDDLPKSFQDAIMTCRRLRIQYLWIDSLCILQTGAGAEKDWQIHVASMHIIYANCVLNLAALGASDPAQGMFVERDPRFIRTAFVYVPESLDLSNAASYVDNKSNSSINDNTACEGTSTGIAGSSDTRDGAENGTEDARKVCLVTIFSTVYDFCSSVLKQPLWSRGWVFQERLMAPRTLLFGQDRVYWQCNEQMSNEYLPKGLPGSNKGFDETYVPYFNLPPPVLRPASPPLSSMVLSELYVSWYSLINEYSMKDLTYPDKDKLSAIAAVASRFGHVIPGRYCAGLFESDIIFGLLWRHGHGRSTSQFNQHTWWFEATLDGSRSPNYRAPTWSWISVDGRIHSGMPRWEQQWLLGSESHGILARAENISIELEDSENPFGRVVAGSLMITGPTFFPALKDSVLPEGESDLVGFLQDKSQQDFLGLCILEEIHPKHAFTYSETSGIILSPLGNNTYKRVGYFELRTLKSGTRLPIDAMETRSVTIL